MRSEPIATLVLSDGDRAILMRLAESVAEYPSDGYDSLERTCRASLPQLREALGGWYEATVSSGVGVLENVPIDRWLQDTPTVRGAADHTSHLTDRLAALIAFMFGDLYTFGGKTTPRHIQNLYPCHGDEGTQLASSDSELEWHVEDGFHPARPHWVVLLCLRGDSACTTRFARARDIQLEEHLVQLLRSQAYPLRIDDSYDPAAQCQLVETAVLAGVPSDPHVVFDPAYTVLQEGPHLNALRAFQAAADAAAIEVSLAAGNLVAFDNRRVIHARTAYQPRMDGTDRWLKRALVLNDAEMRSKLTGGVMPIAL